MIRRAGLAAAVVLASICAGWAAQDAGKLAAQNALLDKELVLAKNPVTYIIINLQEGQIQLKSRGIVLRTWCIQKSRIWGRPVEVKELKLLKKSALSKPERKNITPGIAEVKDEKIKNKAADELETLELKDMPLHFALTFGDNIRISVRPKTKRFWPFLLNIGTSLSRIVVLPLKSVWNAVKGKKFTDIEIVTPSEKDAQGLYWSYLDGHATIIVFQIK